MKTKIIYTLLLVLFLFPSAAKATFDVSTATYDNVSFSVAGESSFPMGIFFKPDGTKMYVADNDTGTIHQYSLSSAWNLSTAAYNGVNLSVVSEDYPTGLFFTSDGTKMYFVANHDIYRYSLSSAWDLSTATYDNNIFSVLSEQLQAQSVYFKPNGTKMYVIGSVAGVISQYSLGTPWDLSTATYDNTSFSFSGVGSFSGFTRILNLFMNTDGTEVIVSGTLGSSAAGTPTVYHLSLSTPWDISTGSIDSSYIISEDTLPTGVFLKPDNSKMYLVGGANTAAFQYSFPDTTPPTVSTLSPADNAVKIATNSNFVITFDEAVNVGTGNIIIKKTKNNSTLETIDVTSGNVTGGGTDTITIDPTENLEKGVSYYIQIDSTAFTDLSGNPYAGISDATTWNFKTISATFSGGLSGGHAPITSSLNPPQINVCPPGAIYNSQTGAKCNTVTLPTESHAPYNFGTILVKFGTKGESCKAWQMFFNEKTNAKLVVDSICGKFTIAVAKLWQASVGLIPDGLLGPLSRGKALN
jgi:hypothetical protein